MANENHITNQPEHLPASAADEKPCARPSSATLRRAVIAGCLLFWLVVIGIVLW